MKVLVYYLLIADAQLMIDLLVTKLPQSLLGCQATVFVVLHGIDDIVIGHTTFYNIVEGLQVS